MGQNVCRSQCECLNVWVLVIGAWASEDFQHLWRDTYCKFTDEVLLINNSKCPYSWDTWWGKVRRVLIGKLELGHLSQGAGERSYWYLLCTSPLPAKVWESLFSLLTGKFEPRQGVRGLVPSIRNWELGWFLWWLHIAGDIYYDFTSYPRN